MDRRGFLKFAFGVAAAGAATIAAAHAAPLAPQALTDKPLEPDQLPQHALANDDDLNEAQVEQVRWGRGRSGGRRWGFRRRRFWGRRRRYWRRRRFWGWRRRRVYRRRFWRRRRYW
ncbi:MAG TPA: twin-arginine translocation signal domain-containing protein [Afipia sp.]